MGMDAIGIDIQRAKSSRAQVFFFSTNTMASMPKSSSFIFVSANLMGMDAIGIDIQCAKSSRAQFFFFPPIQWAWMP